MEKTKKHPVDLEHERRKNDPNWNVVYAINHGLLGSGGLGVDDPTPLENISDSLERIADALERIAPPK